jgi:hypothetical protein
MTRTSRLNSDCVLVDPIRALLRRPTTINASDHTCRIPDAVSDFSATPALVTLAPGDTVRGFTLVVRRDGRGYGVAACRLRYGLRGDDEGELPDEQACRVEL